MTDSAPQQTTPPPAALPTLTEALRNPSQLLARRAAIVKAATDRAQQAAAAARTRLQNVEAVAATRVQDLRKSTDALVATTVARVRNVSAPARVRSAVSGGLVRAAQSLQTLASRVGPAAGAPAEAPKKTE